MPALRVQALGSAGPPLTTFVSFSAAADPLGIIGASADSDGPGAAAAVVAKKGIAKATMTTIVMPVAAHSRARRRGLGGSSGARSSIQRRPFHNIERLLRQPG